MLVSRNTLIVAAALGCAAISLGLTGALVAYDAYQTRLADARQRLGDDLETFPVERFGRIFSARSWIREGQWVDLDLLEADLSASGFLVAETRDALRTPHCVDSLYRAPDNLVVRQCAGPDEAVSVRVDEEGYVSSIHPGPELELPPLMLTRIGDPELRRVIVQPGEVSEWVVPALLASEDERFFNHPGVDMYGVARAAVTNLQANEVREGASTLTQQLIKNTYLTPERSYERKVEEAFLAMAIERQLSKGEILQWYLTEAYFGHVRGTPIHGIEDGAQAYFGIPASSLTLDQAALLVSMLPQPNQIDPIQHPEAALDARDRLIDRMIEVGAVTAMVGRRAKQRPIETSPRVLSQRHRAVWASDWAVEAATHLVGDIHEADTLQLTIDPVVQTAADRSVAEVLETLRAKTKRQDLQAALIAMRPESGEVVAIVGSADYESSRYDRARRAWREVGSTVKPFIFATALERGSLASPLSPVADSPVSLRVGDEIWTPRNYTHSYRGQMPAHRALELSRNAAMVRLASKTGFGHIRDTLKLSGFDRTHRYPSLALGAYPSNPLEMASAYTTFVNQGVRSEPTILRRVVADDETIVVEPERTPVMDPANAAVVRSVLEGVAWRGTAARLRWEYGFEGDLGGKTGTTNDGRDSWFVGIRPDLVIVGWVGADQGEPVGLTGSSGAMRVVADFLKRIPAAEGAFQDPTGTTEQWVCSGGYLPLDECPCPDAAYPLTFRYGRVPEGRCEEDEVGDTDTPADDPSVESGEDDTGSSADGTSSLTSVR